MSKLNFKKDVNSNLFKTPTQVKKELSCYELNCDSICAQNSDNFEYENFKHHQFKENAIRMELLSCQSFECSSCSQSDLDNLDEQTSIFLKKKNEEFEIPIGEISSGLQLNNRIRSSKENDSYASNRGGIAVGFKEVSFQTPPQKLKDTCDIMCSNNKVTDKVNRRLFQHFKYLPSEERKEVRLDQTESLQYAPKKNKRGSSLTSKNGNSNECIHFSGNKIRPIGMIYSVDIDNMNISQVVSSFSSSTSRFNDVSDSSQASWRYSSLKEDEQYYKVEEKLRKLKF